MAVGYEVASVAKRRTITYGPATVTREQLRIDVEGWTRDQVIGLLRTTAVSEISAQEDLDNPPQIIISDGLRDKSAMQATRHVQAMFGTSLDPQALTVLKQLLSRAIASSTVRRTGALASVDANWRYVYVAGGRTQALPIGNRSGIPMAAGDFIILRPERVPHATVANIAASGGRYRAYAARRAERGKAPPRANRGMGFMGEVARAARRHPIFAGFRVAVRFTRHTVPGELWSKGLSATFIITPEVGRRQRRRRR